MTPTATTRRRHRRAWDPSCRSPRAALGRGRVYRCRRSRSAGSGRGCPGSSGRSLQRLASVRRVRLIVLASIGRPLRVVNTRARVFPPHRAPARSFSRPRAEPSCCHPTPNTSFPRRLNDVSSTATVSAPVRQQSPDDLPGQVQPGSVSAPDGAGVEVVRPIVRLQMQTTRSGATHHGWENRESRDQDRPSGNSITAGRSSPRRQAGLSSN